jgi:hypothetical protein
MLNDEVVELLDPEWMFEFTGIDIKTESELIDQRNKELMGYKMLDETREEAGLDPVGEEAGGNLILNPQYMQWKMQQDAAAGQDTQGIDSTIQEGVDVTNSEDPGNQDNLWE